GLPMADGWKEQLSKLGVVFGVNAPFLHYSPEQEAEASDVTAKLLRAAGFKSEAFDELFRALSESSKKPDAPILTFLYNHPLPEHPADADTDADAPAAPRTSHHERASQEFRSFQAALQKLPKPREDKAPEVEGDPMPGLLVHPLKYYSLNYPDGWQVVRTSKD